jgi:hypothetical protein
MSATSAIGAPELSVVLAVPGPAPALGEAITALRDACAGIPTELLIMSAADAPADHGANAGFVLVRVERRSPGTLTPVLWGDGARLARANVVAFTTDHMRVGNGWARALLGAIRGQTAGAAGPITLAPDAGAATAAAYFLRFSAFAPTTATTAFTLHDIPGDNAAYSRAAIAAHADLLAEGFWEVEFHRRFARDGLVLQMVPSAQAELAGPVPFGAMLAQRFRHGAEFGATRVHRRGESRARLLLAAPVVPAVLLARTARRAMSAPRNRAAFVGSLPLLGVLAAAWAAGEAAGALRGPPPSHGAPQ